MTIIAFQIILLFIIPVTFITMYDPKNKPEQVRSYAFVCGVAMLAFLITLFWIQL